jgi:SAM-dependent methyltransferase
MAYRHFRNGGANPPPDFEVRPGQHVKRATVPGRCGVSLNSTVGSGAGHWTRTIAPHLSRGSRLTAIDSDPKWADSNASWLPSLATQGLEVTIERAGAEAIPFPDAEFDFVTCQTVLIHVADPRASIAEMLRVLQPGGLFLCVEPDNFGTYAAATSLGGGSSLEDEAAAFKFNLAQQRGRKALGHGDASLGAVLPGLLAASGLTDLQVHLSDKAIPLFPPYGAPEQRAVLGDTPGLNRQRTSPGIKRSSFSSRAAARFRSLMDIGHASLPTEIVIEVPFASVAIIAQVAC